METLHFKVADAYFSLSAPSARLLKALLPSYAPFYVKAFPEDCHPILQATIADGAVNLSPEGEEIGTFDCGGANHAVYRTAEGYKILIHNENHVLSAALATTDRFACCRVTLFGQEEEQRFGLGNALMIAFAFAGAHHGILLMHASVAAYQGRAYLFQGKSGTGKSTHTRLWLKHIPGCDLLNDDNPAVRSFDDGRVITYGTPWSGKTPCYRNLSMPAGGFVRLEQWPDNSIRRLPTLEAFASILSSCSTMIWDKPSYDGITRTVTAIVGCVPAWHLKCRPDEAAARLSETTITKPTR